MNIKKAVGFVSLVLASIVLVACSGKQDDNNTLTIGVMTKTASDQARWDKIEELLKKDKITLKYKEFTDYSQPNKAVANGEVDINSFQHYNFLDNWNKENKADLKAIAETYISPIHLFSGTSQDGKAKYKSIDELPDGAQIAVPNDATNESRALYVLQAAGLIKLNVSGDKLATIANITENKKKLDIKELDASQTARALTSADAAIVNNSYAVPAKIDFKTSLFKEKADENAKQWINIIAAQKDWEKSAKADAIKKLIKAYHTDDVKKIVDKTSNGVDVPVW
ncbi:TPA: MetQ/NlpA family ABC transporter substrate-binding protein [Streptococcus equi subsp. zooepidemicus]|uniref:MetQ/NlpA family ABC transporter substrate-binding protein n=1 Tax=Streptococcus equi TaxID=1336 RepID=UPI00197EFC85|nr:MetQ/NlpA family ABC transporter substrate-binding protein [Streptococcus equi]MCD3404274.1 MetQ/NlpA family ABC transporter substrate-binding protein [Streptococcus equi subsp. zooepidemicus]MCD3407874.1 MetQ/NlpA family ABC transporter substrate-binding protein [Streptococcus equi subsp. zooepidemicus]MDI5901536.1 MetQ/NlpA family ABC transporter substrate-binding protein [Streptococcus equi subsp. zooepidemicus]MDI5947966.1 MetQ/NlpA family ABC transporter substrate-binding protein [Strep